MVAARLDPDLGDRPLHPVIETARSVIEGWSTNLHEDDGAMIRGGGVA
jgi:hypothetical protein